MLFVILLVLIGRSVTLEGAGAGIAFYLKPDFSKLTGPTLLAATGQAFFSLSLGMGCMITYGSYLDKKTFIPGAAAQVCFLDTAVAFLPVRSGHFPGSVRLRSGTWCRSRDLPL